MNAMTEDEAKTKWCPFARYPAVVADPGANVGYPNPAVASNANSRCIGSACMAWCEVDAMDERVLAEDDAMPADSGWRKTDRRSGTRIVWERRRNEVHGYCGLAAKSG